MMTRKGPFNQRRVAWITTLFLQLQAPAVGNRRKESEFELKCILHNRLPAQDKGGFDRQHSTHNLPFGFVTVRLSFLFLLAAAHSHSTCPPNRIPGSVRSAMSMPFFFSFFFIC